MTDVIQPLAQLSPAANTLTQLIKFSGPTVVSSLIICNRNAATALFAVSRRLSGAADADAQYLYDGTAVPFGRPFEINIGPTFGQSDEIWVSANMTRVAFNLFGIRVS